jgi:hypothetical protein
LERTESTTSFKNTPCRKYSFQKLTHFSQGNNVLDSAASSIDYFLGSDSCFCST